MSIHVALTHVTSYRYDRAVSLGPQTIRLRPAPQTRTPVLAYSLTVEPSAHFINWQQDPQGNWLARLVFPDKTREFKVVVDLVAEMTVINPFDFFLEPEAEQVPFSYADVLKQELAPYLVTLPASASLQAYLLELPQEPVATIDFLVAVNQRLQQDIAYLIRMEPGVQSPDETLRLRSGSCRDSAWLLVQVLRHLGLAARFVSGYLIQLVPDVKALDGPTGPEQDFTDLHAWCEVYLPGAGWVGLDPTSGLFAGEGHIPLAASPEPASAAPISGAVDPCEVEFEHRMEVRRIWEAPRVTRPYSPEQWAQIDTLGRRIDADLEAGDVRLTMGGEPTFVATDDPDGDEWNTAALGPSKRRLAIELFHRLRAEYAPQGLVHFGQGKWYPGEQLPRWSLNCFWRVDGEPIWTDPALYADERRPGVADAETAQVFLQVLARKLEVDSGHIFPAYEDGLYYLWRERRLPLNVLPTDARLEDPLERERLRRVFAQGLGHTVGYVLPLIRDLASDSWQTGRWFLREEVCYLLPGDSPLGYRLPLDSLPWVAAADYPYLLPVDPSQRLPPLARYEMLQQPLAGPPRPAPIPALAPPPPGKSAAGIVRRAMCAEARDGVLYLFMPPLERLEDYLALVAAIESVAAELKLPVVLEGYEPPRDPRLQQFRVTPDPGVIEVNIHPARSWQELSERIVHLYEAAHQTRLRSEKFMLDGRHTGTGGGNHFTLGATTPLDSPFLRRPGLLRSVLSYWHNHPSLSYLFSGMFVGPTSQAPRVDEARNDSLYELELAFAQFPSPGDPAAPWLVDRLLRNLLIDVTGNTHRAEFSIDKLYSPDSATGRLGLLEMRAFEMPPHPQMSLVQQLLLRALIARFWQQPYAPSRLVRWGTELHDRFMLPYFVRQDFLDVLEETAAAGYGLAPDWFDAHFEFRFPKIGSFGQHGIVVELRQAMEPWPVLGEEGMVGGTVRFVDSSVERLQVLVTGMASDRYRLACNGHTLPLTPTGRVGEFVAGVRYKAWQPVSSLHPTMRSQSPLVFDLVDTWMGRSVGGAKYQVAHPGGRNFEHFPVNANEAESRRRARFAAMDHHYGPIDAADPIRNPDFPFTLDLRREEG
ncbi:transglutaminase family protein [Frateuria aurantia]